MELKEYYEVHQSTTKKIENSLKGHSEDVYFEWKVISGDNYWHYDNEDKDYAVQYRKKKAEYDALELRSQEAVTGLTSFKFVYGMLSRESQAVVDELVACVENTSIYYSGYSILARSYRSRKNYKLYITHIYDEMVNYLAYDALKFDLQAALSGKKFWKDNSDISPYYLMVMLNRKNNQTILDCLSDMVYGNENLLSFSNPVIKGMLFSTSEKAHDMVLDLLKAAKLSEGLRQAVVESIDLAPVPVFKRFLAYIHNENLIRFSSVKRACLAYMGLEYVVADEKQFSIIGKGVYQCMVKEKTREYLESGSSLEFYLGLYSLAVYEVYDAIEYIYEHYKDLDEHLKYVCIYFFVQSGYKIDGRVALEMLNAHDSDKMFAAFTMIFSERTNPITLDTGDEEEFIQTVSRRLDKYKRPPKLAYLAFKNEYTPAVLFNDLIEFMITLAERSRNPGLIDLAYRHIGKLGSYYTTRKFAFIKLHTPAQRRILIELLNSAKTDAREFAHEKIRKLITEFSRDEYQIFAGYLKSKRGDLRSYVMEFINTADTSVLADVIKGLLKDKNKLKKAGAVDLLVNNQERLEGNKDWGQLLALAETIKFDGDAADKILRLKGEVQDDTRDFYDPGYKPDIHPPEYDKKIVNEFLKVNEKHLLDFVTSVYSVCDELSGQEYDSEDYDGSMIVKKFGFEERFVRWGLSTCIRDDDLPLYKRYPFYEKWTALHDKLSNYEIHTLQMLCNTTFDSIFDQYSDSKDMVGKIEKLGYSPKVKKLKKYLGKEKDNGRSYRIIRDVLEIIISYKKEELKSDLFETKQKLFLNMLAYYSKKEIRRKGEGKSDILYDSDSCANYFSFIFAQSVNEDDMFEYKFFDDAYALDTLFNFEKVKPVPYYSSNYPVLIYFIKKGLLKEDYIYKLALDSREYETKTRYAYGRYSTSKDSNAKECMNNLFNYMFRKDVKDEHALTLYKNVTQAMLAVEWKRTDLATPYSRPLNFASRFFSIEVFLRTLYKMGKTTLARGYFYADTYSKKEVFSNIIYHCLPAPDDTQDRFNELVKTYQISNKRLLEATMYNLKFAGFTEKHLGWKGLKKAVYYFQAHMNEYFNKNKEAEIRRYTPLEIQELQNGAIDINWFKDSLKTLKKKRFMMLYDCAKYITDGAKHKRAQYFADALMGNIKQKEVLDRIDGKRNKDMVLAYSLLPFRGNKTKQALKRYNKLQQFLKESRQFGAQRRASEALVVSIAVGNLARNMGYSDVTRFSWAMELENIKEIQSCFEPKKVKDVLLHIHLDKTATPKIIVDKEGKKLKNVPVKLKKEKYVVKLKAVVKDLREQYRRARQSLEDAMVNESEFKISELQNLEKHPVIGALVKNLLFTCGDEIGFVAGSEMNTLGGEIKLTEEDNLILTHPVQLSDQKTWHPWQKYVLKHKIKQPFKQVFRELYVMTADEIKNDGYTHRFAGYQVAPAKAVGLLKSRGWLINDYDGFEKINHNSNLRINLYSYADWFTPGDIEPPSLEKVVFSNNKTNKTYDMEKLSKVKFSEAMRDIDLVVSVAHVGGVDPMLNHTTIEMRKNILAHNLELFRIDNTSFDKHHVNIKGAYGKYSLHLGSGIAHMENKGMLPIFPVHSQYKNKIFLPFVDEDPKTAEIISIILMLAQDNNIKDPSVLMHLK